jgi:hypothetical protein
VTALDIGAFDSRPLGAIADAPESARATACGSIKGHDEVSGELESDGRGHRRGRGFFGSGAACKFTPSMVFRAALAAAGVAPSSSNQVEPKAGQSLCPACR